MPTFSALPEICLSNFMLSVSTNSTSVSASQFAQIDSTKNKLILESTNFDIMGFYVMKIQALEPRRGMTKDVLFNLTIDCKVTKVFLADVGAVET